jgi:hypothetical protein
MTGKELFDLAATIPNNARVMIAIVDSNGNWTYFERAKIESAFRTLGCYFLKVIAPVSDEAHER